MWRPHHRSPGGLFFIAFRVNLFGDRGPKCILHWWPWGTERRAPLANPRQPCTCWGTFSGIPGGAKRLLLLQPWFPSLSSWCEVLPAWLSQPRSTKVRV